MWVTLAVGAILLAVVPSSALSSGFQRKSSLRFAATDYRRLRCISFIQPRGGLQPSVRNHCVPGATFKIGCNKCLCRKSGLTAFCSRKNCKRILQSGCTPGSILDVECNSCICSPAGRWACTDWQCKPKYRDVDCEDEPIEPGDGDTAPHTCVPSTSFMMGCNRCYCARDGVSAVCRSLPCNGVRGVLLEALPSDIPGPPEPDDITGPPEPDDQDESEGWEYTHSLPIGGPSLRFRPDFKNNTHACLVHKGEIIVCAEFENKRGGPILSPNLRFRPDFKNDSHACLVHKGEIIVCVEFETKIGGPISNPNLRLNTDFKNETHACLVHKGEIIVCVEFGSKIGGPISNPNLRFRPDFKNDSHGCLVHKGEIIVCVEFETNRGGPIGSPSLRFRPDFKNDSHACLVHKGEIIICVEFETKRGGPRHRIRRCTPLTTFMDDCNTCRCSQTGEGASCTRMDCRPRGKRDVSCTPGSSATTAPACKTASLEPAPGGRAPREPTDEPAGTGPHHTTPHTNAALPPYLFIPS